jgi:hypothetical protein
MPESRQNFQQKCVISLKTPFINCISYTLIECEIQQLNRQECENINMNNRAFFFIN